MIEYVVPCRWAGAPGEASADCMITVARAGRPSKPDAPVSSCTGFSGGSSPCSAGACSSGDLCAQHIITSHPASLSASSSGHPIQGMVPHTPLILC